MSKLTLSVDERVVTRAKRLAQQQGISVSKMVEGYLAAVVESSHAGTRDAPILRSLQGSLKRADPLDYKKHLEKKYR